MIRLISEGRPTVVFLQEVPLWALPWLERWSGMQSVATRTRRALAGPLGRRLQALHPRWFRSAVTGQALALLLDPELVLERSEEHQLSAPGAPERRFAQLLHARNGDTQIVLVNTHLSIDETAAREELARLGALLPARTPAVIGGDLNVVGLGVAGFSAPCPRIDQLLARGFDVMRGPAAWPDARRSTADRPLSDHAPLEAEFVLS